MAEYVHSGEKLLASQYNALVDALAGPAAATTDQPFTQTKNGIVVNGGLGRQTTKAASTVPAMFEVSYGDGYVGPGYSTYQQGDVDANRFNGVFLNIGSWDAQAYNGFVLGNGLAIPALPLLTIIDPTSDNAAAVVYNNQLGAVTRGKLPLCKATENAGYALVQVVDNGEAGKARNGDFVLLVGNFIKLGARDGSDIRFVSPNNVRAAVRGISIYENCEDARVVQGGTLWRHDVIAGAAGSTIPHLSYTVGTQYVDMLPDAYVDKGGAPSQVVWPNAQLPVKLKSIGIVPPQQMGFNELNSTNTLELHNFDKLSSDITSLDQVYDNELTSYDVLVKHKNPHPYAEDDPAYEGQAEADLEYVALSCLVQPGDADANRDGVIDTGLSSVEFATIDGNSFYELYGFRSDGTLGPSDLSSGGVEVVVRDSRTTGGNGARVNYVALSDLLSGVQPQVKVDSENSQCSSISRDDDQNLELLNFSDSSYLAESVDSGDQIVVRSYSGGNPRVQYATLSAVTSALAPSLSSAGISGDANYGTLGQNSIQTKTQNGKTYHQLYDWDYYGYNYEHVLSAAFGSTVYFPSQNGTGGASSPSNGARVLVKPRESPVDLQYDVFGVRLPKVDVNDITQNLYDLILSSGGTDLCAVRRIVIDTLDDPDAKEPLSSNLDDCFWPQGGDNSDCYGSSVGNSIKEQVVDLDGTKLKATGTNQSSLDWASGICVDSEGEQSITWDGRGLIDSDGVWSIDWDGRQGYNSYNDVTIDWENKVLSGYWRDAGSFSVDSDLAVGGNASARTLTIGSTTINETQLQQLLALLTTVPQTLQGI